jgi:hypothetical protein
MPEKRRRGTAICCALAAAAAILAVPAAGAPAAQQRYDGFNVIAVPSHPFGSPRTRASLMAARLAGAEAVAIVPFLWQRDPRHAAIVRGTDMPDADLRLAIREAHAVGFRVMIKPHVWLDGSWAGAVEPSTPDDWQGWFDRYREHIVRIAKVAAEEGAAALSIGTELKLTTQRGEWTRVIADVRSVFAGLLTYSAHNLEEAETVPFWRQLDAIGVTLYPKLGEDGDQSGRRAIMQATAERLDRLGLREDRPVIVTEIGLRSAAGAAAKPWESAEERTAPADPDLQLAVLADWLAALDRPSVSGVLVWRWFTDPGAGGASDTDFTVQGKPAERVFLCSRAKDCR